MKKVIFIILSVLLLSSLLATGMLLSACGSTKTATLTTTQTQTTQTTTTQTSTTQVVSTSTATTLTTLTIPGETKTTTTTKPGTPKYGGTLTVSEPIFPGQPLGYLPESSGAAPGIYQQICLEPLLKETIDGVSHPRLATEWTVAPDGSSITFKLRKGVLFHDGTEFNAQAVKWNFDLIMAAKKAATLDWTSVDVIDSFTVRVNLSKWTNGALSNFNYGSGTFIVSPTAYEKLGVEGVRFNMVGTGPFKQVDYVRDTMVVYEKNTSYWDPTKPYLDKIIYKCVPDPMTQVAALKSKELDGMASGADARLADLVANGLVAVTGTLGTANYFPDSIHPDSPLAKKAFREALEYAIDKEAIAEAFSYGFWTPAYQWCPPTAAAYDPSLLKRTYDVPKAKALLAEAGYPNGTTINFLVSGDEPGKSIAQAIQDYWREIGVETNIELLPSAKFEEYQRTGWNNGLLYGSPIGPSDWAKLMSGTLSSNPASTAYVSVEKPQEYKDLLDAALTSFMRDPVKQKAVVKYVHDNEMCIPIWNVVRAWVTQPYVKDGGFLTDASAFFWNADTIWLDK
jgi:peptide/nickel transport system substrate-binding protein